MVSFGEKAKIKKAGNLNEGRSYVITTVHPIDQFLFNWIENNSLLVFSFSDLNEAVT